MHTTTILSAFQRLDIIKVAADSLMRQTTGSLILLTLCISACHVQAAPPNMVLIVIDDMGWGDVGCYGNSFIDTPRIDQLAAEGIRFTNFYAAGAVCSPTRCAVQSGQNQARIGITAHIPGHWRPYERVITPQTTMALPLDTVTIAESLRAAGYRTGYVGKWHLGPSNGFGPADQGYQFAAEINGPHLPGRFSVTGNVDATPRRDQFRTDFEAQLCEQFISENRDQPFFLMLSPFAVHIPLAGKSQLVQKYRQRAADRNQDLPSPIYAAMVEEVDTLVGRVVDAIDSAGLAEQTMIVFTSDNGGLNRRYDYRQHADDLVSSLLPLKGEKGSLHEGGIRVPLIIRQPGAINPGTTTDEPAISYDFYPTFVSAAGAQLPVNQTIDGVPLQPVLQLPTARLQRDALHWHYPHYHHDRPSGAIREREWKLIEYLDGSGDIELYQLSEDLGEQHNLAAERPGRTADLLQKLRSWRTTVSARMPISNPAYDPERAAEWWNLRSGEPVDSDSRMRFPQTENDLSR